MSNKKDKRVLVTGATGFIGKKLIKALLKRDDFKGVNVLSTRPEKAQRLLPDGVTVYSWNPSFNLIDSEPFQEVDVIVNLAGESVASKFWSEPQKRKIIDSRIQSTGLLKEQINKFNVDKKVKLINASAVGYYGNAGAEELTEISPKGEGFLADVCGLWEDEVYSNLRSNVDVSILRLGVVLDPDEGALSKMLPAFRLGLGAKIGNGQQYMSWIHIDDLIDIIIWSIENDFPRGVYNVTAPNPVTNKEFSKTLAKTLSRPCVFSAPAFALKLVLGEQSSIVIDGQRAIPKKLLQQGYKFKYNDISEAFKDLLK